MSGDLDNSITVVVAADQSGLRLDHLLSEVGTMSRSQAQKLIKAGGVVLNGQVCRPKDQVAEGDEVRYAREGGAEPKFEAKFLPLNIVYEDDDLMVINKDAGVVVHPGAGTGGQVTLAEGVAYYLQSSGKQLPGGDALRPGIVHRLDKDTSGAMLIAKSTKALNSLAQQFKDKTNLREYLALLNGKMSQDLAEVETYLHRDPRHRTRYASISLEDFEALEEAQKKGYKYAKSTFYHRTSFANGVSLVQVRLSTGRTHQIRVHSKVLKLPIIGDDTYGQPVQLASDFPAKAKKALQGVNRQMLHAKKLGFTHPTTGEKLGFEVPLPEDFRQVLEVLSQETGKE